MRESHRRLALGVIASGLLALAACGSDAAAPGSSADEPAGHSAEEAAGPTTPAAAAPTVYGEPVDPSGPDPTDVATDSAAPRPPADEDEDGGATVLLTYSGWNVTTGAVEVDGYVPDLVESDGTCTLTLTQGATSVTATTPGTADVTTTACGGATVPGAQLSPGTWTAVLRYESSRSTASSEPAEVTVP